MAQNTSRTIIAVDALGGDFAPQVVLDGAELALQRDADIQILMVGPADTVEPFAANHTRVRAIPTTQVIAMDEHPAAAVRSKKDSSIVVCARLVKEGAAQATFSAGSTGACLAAATLVTGRIKGVKRPALAVILPGARPTVLIDNGANADCKPEYLVQFAEMGRAYAQAALGVEQPRIALLSIGEEDSKGNQLVLDAHALLRQQTAGFIGNVEGRDILAGAADVIVCDGFTGNVVLKTLEGTLKFLLGKVKGAMTASTTSKLAALVLKGNMGALKDELDPDQYGAAPLLGVNGLCLVGHGSSNARAIASGILVGARAVRGGVTDRITEALSR
ncbi:MAG: phosphate acyltransferase PlsX [Actinomycetes bacterium]|jgi:glycerol-3-phosphate acyltransferase PlsX|nr:phosphate acyltransferase PlsX [Actinomycetes bacterium]